MKSGGLTLFPSQRSVAEGGGAFIGRSAAMRNGAGASLEEPA